MALLTPIALHDARRLGVLYGLDVAAARPILAGSVNTNVELSLTGGGRAFLRVYEEQTVASAAGEARLLEHLAAGGVVTPRPLSLRDDPAAFIAEHAGKPVAVFPWIDGESLCQARVTPAAAAAVGEALARVHVAGASFAGAPPNRFGPAELDRRLRSIRERELDPELAAVASGLAARLERLASRAPSPTPGTPLLSDPLRSDPLRSDPLRSDPLRSEPLLGEGLGWGLRSPAPALDGAGLVHGDLFRDNVLWKDGSISALLDFESASHGSYAFDLMVTILAWCFGDGLDPALARAMAQGYARVRPLSADEAARLYDEGSFAALRFSITRITDFELRPRGTSVHKDYRRFLARAAALDALGQEGLPTFLGL